MNYNEGDKLLPRDEYFEERKALDEGEGLAALSFDKTMVTLAAGAIALSLTLIKDKTPPPGAYLPIKLTWIFLTISLVSILCSFLVTQYAFRRQKDFLDDFYEGKYKNRKFKNKGTRWATRLNIVSIASFTIGIFAMVYFAFAIFK